MFRGTPWSSTPQNSNTKMILWIWFCNLFIFFCLGILDAPIHTRRRQSISSDLRSSNLLEWCSLPDISWGWSWLEVTDTVYKTQWWGTVWMPGFFQNCACSIHILEGCRWVTRIPYRKYTGLPSKDETVKTTWNS